MARNAAIAVVLDETRQRVLVHKREDFRIWALPGGMIEADETPEDAAIRETYEETGYQIKIQRAVAEYQRPQISDDIAYLYKGVAIGGEAIEQGPETLAVAWLDVDSLPNYPVINTRRYVADTLANHPYVLKETILFPQHMLILRSIALNLRNLRNRFFRRG